MLLALELDAWWHKRGFIHVKHTAQCARFAKRHPTQPFGPPDQETQAHTTVWTIRSNLRNGLPPKVAP